MSRVRTLNSKSTVNDATKKNLILAGWTCEDYDDWYNSMWVDPRSGQWYAVSQAAAILADRQTPRYDFRYGRQGYRP